MHPVLTDELAAGLFQAAHQPLIRAIVDNLSEGVIIADAAGTLLYFSPAARAFQLFGLERMEKDRWRQHFTVTDPDTHQPFNPENLPLTRALRGEAHSAHIFIRSDQNAEGQYLHASGRPVKDSEGKLLGALIFIRDTTRERQAEARQRRAEQRFRLIVEAAQEGIWTIDPEGRTTYVNRYLAQMLGYTEEEMLGQDTLTFIAEEHRERVRNNLAQRRAGISDVHELALRHKSGRSLWTIISSNPLYDEEGQYSGALGTITDITRRREAEQRVHQLNADLERRIAERTAQLEFSNRELEAFAYSVAHDLRAPLRSISSFSLALTEDCASQLDSMGLEYLQRIRASSQRMSDLIDGILSLSRVNRSEFQVTDVNLSALARLCAEQLRRWQPERAVSFHLQEGLVDRGDTRLLRSVLENLLGNAWKFTRERAQAEIHFGALPEEPGTGRVYFVRDNGAGFDMEYQAKLFGVFQRLHTQQEFEGNGVGLATVQRIIRRHGGRVWGEGTVGQGATFYFTLHEPTRTPRRSPPWST
ncbi:sensor histidine kinase [Melittangium boletus]|uniref:histidine kinase n=1 Tax=Melittangium boletus DSM 14713 TaxID=1294270 RepID=A0A250IC82_9BACT|nr:PAS domain S-box protein [Melittangium boletus]ATB28782.1 PAS domain-containing sensor histidine kinase [Melittangium boletus DSM 14713]